MGAGRQGGSAGADGLGDLAPEGVEVQIIAEGVQHAGFAMGIEPGVGFGGDVVPVPVFRQQVQCGQRVQYFGPVTGIAGSGKIVG